ncbi:MAG TPA: tetratricopeptide repeat protein, partial [Nannocystis sp.]
ALGHLGGALLALGRHDEARVTFERALALRRQAIGAEDPAINGILAGLGGTLAALGEHDEAIPILERALSLREELGVDKFHLAPILNNLGRSLRQLGRHEEARRMHERALALQEAALGPSHANVAASLLGLGELALARGEPALALPLLERALTLHSVEDHANVQLALAEALWPSEQDRPRARALATAAQEHWRGLGHQPNLARATAWLATHPGV